MEILSQINTIQLCILIGIGFLLLLQQVGIKKGYFVKV
jgi:hypothetical protein